MRAKLNGIIDIGNNKKLLTMTLLDDCEELQGMIDKIVDIDINQHKTKRSKNANSFLWALCGQIADAVETSPVYVYRDAIINVGIYRDFHNLTIADCNTLQVAWSNQGLGWVAQRLDYEPDGDHIALRCFYGSSMYNTKQMSRLLDYVVQEANNIGIKTDNEKITSLLNDWEDIKEKFNA